MEIRIGIFETAEGKTYDCYFDQEEKYAIARGPLPRDSAGSVKQNLYNSASIDEAKEVLSEELGPGKFRD